MPQDQRWGGADYLAFERASHDAKHKLIDGVIVAMTGASRAHNLIMSNINALLNVQLWERDCEVHSADMRVQVRADETHTYPDVVFEQGSGKSRQHPAKTLIDTGVVLRGRTHYNRPYEFLNRDYHNPPFAATL